MRNLVQYPITPAEALRAVKRAADAEVERLGALPPDQVPMGDVHLAALSDAYRRISVARPQLYLDCDGVLADFDKKAAEVFGMDPRAWEVKQSDQIYNDLLGRHDAAKSGVVLTEEQLARLRQRAVELSSQDFWETLYAVENLFEDFEPMPDARELVNAVAHLRPIILTGCPRGYWAVPQKLRWRDQHFPDLPMICVESINKRAHCRPGDVLIDDWPKYQPHWEDEGGVFIRHTSASDSIQRLKELGLL